MSITTLITIAGIRHSSNIEGKTKAERDEASRRFLEGITKGERVMLIEEIGNLKDANAVAAHVKHGIYGRVGRGCLPIVRPLLVNNKLDTKFFCFDGHVTYYVAVESDKPLVPVWENNYSVDKCPLPRGICVGMPESEMNVISYEEEFVRLRDEIDSVPLSELSDDSELVRDFLGCAELLIGNFGHSLARETLYAMTAVGNTLRKYACDDEVKWGKDKLSELLALCDKKNGDLARDSGAAIFKEMWNSALGDEAMIEKYESLVTFCPIAKMKVKDKQMRAGELMEWIKGITQQYKLYMSFKENDWDGLASQLNYLSIARGDLYKVITAFVLVKKLEEKKKRTIHKEKKLKHFFGDLDENGIKGKAKELLNFLGNKAKVELDSSMKNELSIAVVKYVKYNWGEKDINARALFRFLVKDCKLKVNKDIGSQPVSDNLKKIFNSLPNKSQ
ncbi:MAG: hypothetical protein ACI3YZ_01430 [Prevotella sp.]